jgi:hypothetical protein
LRRIGSIGATSRHGHGAACCCDLP